ncbi:hypothetical protein [Mycolicibacterium komossense]|uniref:Predicted hydrolase N-terminal domain-containing protein n=1 Tax=Mycolicibacterium komossense TaxID=1779 RepID=A0ABT3CLV6_9MYCO|nr:hypothetical protein [Mycolicibacterium komossense]MCV7230236.1 hypothetical protein [Mycolicibacterium komossense]
MLTYPQFEHFTAQELAGQAGGDPWQMNAELQTGDPASINSLADAFHQAGARVKDADDQFTAAKKQFEDSYSRNNGTQHPINDGAEVQKVSAALAKHPEELTKIAVDLEQTAAALAMAQRESAEMIDALDEHLHAVDEEISTECSDAPWLMVGFHNEAVEVTKTALDHIENIQGAYADQLRGAETAMIASGYVPDGLDAGDGIPGDSPQDSASKYDTSGQRAKDQALVDKAKREHANGLGWDLDETEAQRRLADYASVTDPSNGAAKWGDAHAKDEAARLAGERLADFNMANSVGPVGKDPVLGGDMRDRANRRLLLQRQLEDAQLDWSQIPMHADDATRRMDQLEVQDRAAALTRLQEQLQANGVSPEGAAKVADGIAHGVIPQEFLDETKRTGKNMEGMGEILKRFSEEAPPGNALGITLSDGDIESLGKVGKTLGRASSALEIGMTLYEVANGDKTLVQGTMDVGASMGGAWALGQAGVFLGAPAGPVGSFVLGSVGAIAGGVAGEKGADALYKYLAGE